MDKLEDIDSLRALCLECPDLEHVHRWMSNYEKWQEWFDAYRQEYEPRLSRSDETERATHPDNLSDVQQFEAALRIAEEIWKSTPEEDTENLRVLAAVTAGETDLQYEADLPALLLYQGSLMAEFIPFIPHVGFALRVGTFFVALALKTGTVAPVLAENMVEELRARVSAQPGCRELKRLNELTPKDVESKKGIIVLLHGLASTDVGTFDGFLDAWMQSSQQESRDMFYRAFRETVDNDFLVVGWPHDTLTSIGTNADNLFKEIFNKIGQEGPPIVFVCHSRGGLVARTAAVIMQKEKGSWTDKVKLCVTFGTPHLGAGLAANPYRFMGLYAAVMASNNKVLSVFRLLSYYAQQKGFEGIDDLRPPEAQGVFLRTLEAAERDLGAPGALRKLKILPVGGVYRGSRRDLMKLVTHKLGTTDNDLVVERKSTVPDDWTDGEIVTCSHFEYFSADQVKEKHFSTVIDAIRKTLGFGVAEAERQKQIDEKPKAGFSISSLGLDRFKREP